MTPSDLLTSWHNGEGCLAVGSYEGGSAMRGLDAGDRNRVGLERHFGSSIKGESEVDWEDEDSALGSWLSSRQAIRDRAPADPTRA